MELNPIGGIPGLPAASEKISFAAGAIPRVRAAWKYDLLRPDGQAQDRLGLRSSRSDRYGRIGGIVPT